MLERVCVGDPVIEDAVLQGKYLMSAYDITH